MHALILVDLQNDFCPGGALAVPGGAAIIPTVNRLVRSAAFDLVVATQDWHPQGHASFAANHPGTTPGQVIDLDGMSQVLWPTHCVQGTHGAAFRDDLDATEIAEVFRKGLNPRVDSYSGFFDNDRRHDTGLAEWLRSRGIGTVTVVGLATDYCVKATAMDANSLGFLTHVVKDAVAGVDLSPGDSERALAEMEDAGIAIVSSTMFK